jgi:hypothetical protein
MISDRSFSLVSHAETLLIGFSVLVGVLCWAWSRNSSFGPGDFWEFNDEEEEAA